MAPSSIKEGELLFVCSLRTQVRSANVFGDFTSDTIYQSAGFGYSFFNDKIRDYSKPIGWDEFSGDLYDMMQPLVHHPGEGWQYGVRDFAAFLILQLTFSR